MTLYCDSSALVKLYVEEVGSDVVERAVGSATTVVTSAIALVEVRSTLARALREARLTRSQFNAIRRRFLSDWANIVSMSVDPALCDEAAQLAERHALRALDGIHLASFQQLLERADDDVAFIGFDDRLSQAASRLQ